MKLFSAIIAALALGAATSAVAQTAAQSFADYFKSMQWVQSGAYMFGKAPPALSGKPTAPVPKESFADAFAHVQANSSNSDQWNARTTETGPTHASPPSNPVGDESFAWAFARMQAASSNSDEWKMPASDGESAYATASTTTIAQGPQTPTFLQRMTRRAPDLVNPDTTRSN